ncbi:MAG TPA: hypothetical protein VFF14_11575 [Candidatus Deferrimicrobium sp.]|nr:hypothetical protein [Candidatus Deferrimicrobium sp.]
MPHIEQTCLNCGTSSDDRPVIAYIEQGEERWCCVRCLPALIHG